MKRRVSDLVAERDTNLYKIGGQRVPSVTEVLTIAGLVDLSGVPRSALEAARDRGRIIHRITAEIDQSNPGHPIAIPDDDWLGYVNAYVQFKKDTGFQPILTEELLKSERHKLAGTLDSYGILNQHKALLDRKTGSNIPPWVALQTAGYELLLEPNCLPVKRYALRLGQDGNYKLEEFRSPSDKGDFLAALRVARWQLRHGGYVLDSPTDPS